MRRHAFILGLGLVVLAVGAGLVAWARYRPAPSPPAALAEAPGAQRSSAAPADLGHDHGHDGHVAPHTPAQQAEADALVSATRAHLIGAGYADATVAEAAGYRAIQPPSSGLVHYVDFDRLADPAVLEPTAPESLIYQTTVDGPVLQGAMFILPSTASPVPQLGGLAGQWHAHDDLCFAADATIVGTLGPDGSCPPGARNEVTPPMLHVWLVERPGGPFAGL